MNRNVKYIVVHATATHTGILAEKFEPRWHYVVKRSGEVVSLVKEEHKTPDDLLKAPQAIHIAYAGGLGKDGEPTDNRNSAQEANLFDKLVELKEKYPAAHIVGADMWNGRVGNPGFDVMEWVRNYVPDLEPLTPAA